MPSECVETWDLVLKTIICCASPEELLRFDDPIQLKKMTPTKLLFGAEVWMQRKPERQRCQHHTISNTNATLANRKGSNH